MNTNMQSAKANLYSGILALKDDEKIALLRRLGAKALISSDNEKASFVRAAIACGAVAMAQEVLKNMDELPAEFEIIGKSSEHIPTEIKRSSFHPSNIKHEIDTGYAMVIVDGKCSGCNHHVKIDLLRPSQGQSEFICPHCLSRLILNKKEIRPYLEDVFSLHMNFLEKKLHRKELSYQDCEQLVQLADAVSPWLLVRFGVLRSERIGHFAMNTEKYFSERAAGITDSETMDFLGHNEPVSNKFFRLLWNRVIRYSPVASVVAPLLSPDSPYSTHRDLYGNNGRDDHKLWRGLPPVLSFNEKDMERGKRVLQEIGIGPDEKYVCLNVRDSAYLKEHLSHKDWSYHDFRDSDINSYKEAALALAEKGYYVLRMGAVTKKKFDVDHPKVIDYSNNFRSEFMDVFLCATCAFMISTGTGIDGISFIFRRPVLYVNYAQVGAVVDWAPNCMTMFKRFFWKDGNRELSLNEIFSHGVSNLNQGSQLDQYGVVLQDNSSEELRMACLEMADLVECDFSLPLSERQIRANSVLRTKGEMVGRLAECYLN